MDLLAARIRGEIPAKVGVPEDSEPLFLLYALLAAAKGVDVQARDVHDAWVLWMRLKGENHPAMVPFEDLDPQTQIEDEPFLAAIRAAVSADRHGDQG